MLRSCSSKVVSLVLMLSPLVWAQNGRYDSSAYTTFSTVGATNALKTVPGATITIWNRPSPQTTQCSNGGCVAATTYTNNTTTTSCAAATPVVLALTTTCTGTADSQGNFGFWAVPGSYQYCVAAVGVTTQCYNVTLTLDPSNGVVKSLNNVQFADQFSGADTCAKIVAAWNALPSSGGVVNAIGFASGNNTCASSPFLTGLHPGQLLLGNSTFQTTASWLLPQAVTVKGIAMPCAAGGNCGGSVIEAVSGFPASTPVVQSGAGSINMTQLEHLVVDCNAQSGASGVKWNDTEEQSHLWDVLVSGCPGDGFTIGDGTVGHSQNSGPFQDLYVVSGGAGVPVATTVGIRFNLGDSETRGIHGMTVNYTGASTTPTNCIVINSAGTYQDIHVEGCTNGINVTSPATHGGVTLIDVDCSGAVTDCIHINSGNVTVIGVRCGGTNAINDVGLGNTITCGNAPSVRVYPEPRSTFTAYLNGALTSLTNFIGAFVPDRAITMTRIDSALTVAGVTCATAPVITVTNGTNSQTLTLANNNNLNSTGLVGVNFAGGSTVQVELTTAASGCGTNPQNLNVAVQYKME